MLDELAISAISAEAFVSPTNEMDDYASTPTYNEKTPSILDIRHYNLVNKLNIYSTGANKCLRKTIAKKAYISSSIIDEGDFSLNRIYENILNAIEESATNHKVRYQIQTFSHSVNSYISSEFRSYTCSDKIIAIAVDALSEYLNHHEISDPAEKQHYAKLFIEQAFNKSIETAGFNALHSNMQIPCIGKGGKFLDPFISNLVRLMPGINYYKLADLLFELYSDVVLSSKQTPISGHWGRIHARNAIIQIYRPIIRDRSNLENFTKRNSKILYSPFSNAKI